MSPLALVVGAERLAQALQRFELAAACSRASASRRARSSACPCTRASSAPASPCTVSASPMRGSATPRTSRRSLRPDDSARTSYRDGGRSSCCTVSACSSPDTACRTGRKSAAGGAAAAACRRCRWRAPPRAAGFSCTIRACRLRPRASAIARASPAGDGPGRRGWPRPGTPSGENHSADSQKCGSNVVSPRSSELALQLSDAILQRAAFDRDFQIANPQIQELFVRPACPFEIRHSSSRYFGWKKAGSLDLATAA